VAARLISFAPKRDHDARDGATSPGVDEAGCSEGSVEIGGCDFSLGTAETSSVWSCYFKPALC
jgi:hypothetical protein